MERAPFKNTDVEELATRFMRELNNRWVTIPLPDNKKLFNFDEIYDAACNTIDQTNTELRKAVKDALIRRGLIGFVNDRQFQRVYK